MSRPRQVVLDAARIAALVLKELRSCNTVQRLNGESSSKLLPPHLIRRLIRSADVLVHLRAGNVLDRITIHSRGATTDWRIQLRQQDAGATGCNCRQSDHHEKNGKAGRGTAEYVSATCAPRGSPEQVRTLSGNLVQFSMHATGKETEPAADANILAEDQSDTVSVLSEEGTARAPGNAICISTFWPSEANPGHQHFIQLYMKTGRRQRQMRLQSEEYLEVLRLKHQDTVTRGSAFCQPRQQDEQEWRGSKYNGDSTAFFSAASRQPDLWNVCYSCCCSLHRDFDMCHHFLGLLMLLKGLLTQNARHLSVVDDVVTEAVVPDARLAERELAAWSACGAEAITKERTRRFIAPGNDGLYVCQGNATYTRSQTRTIILSPLCRCPVETPATLQCRANKLKWIGFCLANNDSGTVATTAPTSIAVPLVSSVFKDDVPPVAASAAPVDACSGVSGNLSVAIQNIARDSSNLKARRSTDNMRTIDYRGARSEGNDVYSELSSSMIRRTINKGDDDKGVCVFGSKSCGDEKRTMLTGVFDAGDNDDLIDALEAVEAAAADTANSLAMDGGGTTEADDSRERPPSNMQRASSSGTDVGVGTLYSTYIARSTEGMVCTEFVGTCVAGLATSPDTSNEQKVKSPGAALLCQIEPTQTAATQLTTQKAGVQTTAAASSTGVWTTVGTSTNWGGSQNTSAGVIHSRSHSAAEEADFSTQSTTCLHSSTVSNPTILGGRGEARTSTSSVRGTPDTLETMKRLNVPAEMSRATKDTGSACIAAERRGTFGEPPGTIFQPTTNATTTTENGSSERSLECPGRVDAAVFQTRSIRLTTTIGKLSCRNANNTDRIRGTSVTEEHMTSTDPAGAESTETVNVDESERLDDVESDSDVACRSSSSDDRSFRSKATRTVTSSTSNNTTTIDIDSAMNCIPYGSENVGAVVNSNGGTVSMKRRLTALDFLAAAAAAASPSTSRRSTRKDILSSAVRRDSTSNEESSAPPFSSHIPTSLLAGCGSVTRSRTPTHIRRLSLPRPVETVLTIDNKATTGKESSASQSAGASNADGLVSSGISASSVGEDTATPRKLKRRRRLKWNPRAPLKLEVVPFKATVGSEHDFSVCTDAEMMTSGTPMAATTAATVAAAAQSSNILKTPKCQENRMRWRKST